MAPTTHHSRNTAVGRKPRPTQIWPPTHEPLSVDLEVKTLIAFRELALITAIQQIAGDRGLSLHDQINTWVPQ